MKPSSCAFPVSSKSPVLKFLALILLSTAMVRGADEPRKLVFDGVLSEHKLALADFAPGLPADWSGYTHLVMEIKTSTPQRFALWAYTAGGARRIELQPFGQNAWFRASIPLQYFAGMDQSGTDLASTINRRTNSFWMSVWGPFGDLKSVEAVGFAMQYPIHRPVIEIRSVHLAKQDEGSDFLEGKPVLDEFGQWAHVDYPRKIKDRAQLDRELAAEEKGWGSAPDFGYCELGGYRATKAKPTGFFHVEQIDGIWWFVDPHGHLFLSTSSNGLNRWGRAPATAGVASEAVEISRTNHRLDAWGLNTGGQGRPNIVFLRWPQTAATTFLGVPDVYAEDYARGIDASAATQCAPHKDDPLLIGYFVGNEPPWGDRESEVVDLILAGPDTATKAKLRDWMAQGDTPARRRQFVVVAFEKYLGLVCSAVRKYDPHHLNLGIRFGGSKPAEEVLRLARVFDVCSINVYEYEPTKQLERSYRLSGRPILIGEFHFGVPENGLGSGLVQVKNQTERGKGYRYFVEQALSLPYALGAHWFTWRDEPVLGRGDGENYNIGFVDSTDRPYPELMEAAKATHLRLFDVHSAKVLPFSERPQASDAGTPSSPWDL